MWYVNLRRQSPNDTSSHDSGQKHYTTVILTELEILNSWICL